MVKIIRKYDVNEQAFRNLELAAEMLTRFGSGSKYYVGVTYFDYGQDWQWTTILRHDPKCAWGDTQALYLVEQERIVKASNMTELSDAVNKILTRKSKEQKI